MRFSHPWVLVVLMVANLADLAAVCFREQIRLAVVNARHGCFPWSPPEVPYRDGMTLCPGQSVVIPIKITFPAKRDRGI